MSRPLVVELFCGRFGWSRGFVAEGFQAVGFDIVHEDYHGEVPEGCELVLQDVLTLHGSQFRDAAAIVASPPCQAYSYRAMPWKKAKALPPPSNELFDACFRIQREASEAAGRYIPMVVENVKGAQPWVGRAAWHYGSYYLWGDVPALMPFAGRQRKSGLSPTGNNPAGTGSTTWFFGNSKGENRLHGVKNGTKVSGLNWSNHGQPGYKAQAFNGTAAQRYREEQGVKQGGDWFGKNCESSMSRMFSSRSDSRKAASAAIAEIPFDLASHIARVFKP